MTEKAVRPLPRAHRNRGQPDASIITAIVGHATEQASQIPQFITSGGIAPGVPGGF